MSLHVPFQMSLRLAISASVEIISKQDRDRLDKIMKEAESVIGYRQDKFGTHYQRGWTTK